METVNSRKKAELMALPFFLGLGINFLETPGTSINIFHNIYYANRLGVFPAGSSELQEARNPRGVAEPGSHYRFGRWSAGGVTTD